MTERIPLSTEPDDEQQDTHQSLFRAAEQETDDQPSAVRSITTPVAQPSWDLFSHASEHDVVEQQQPATGHQPDDMTPRSFHLPFEAETDTVDALDQRRSVPTDDDDYR